jgi:coenzyme PQQ precursor peptide PqqA
MANPYGEPFERGVWCGATTTFMLRESPFHVPLRPRLISAAKREHGMAWTTPVLVEICIGMEINAYAPAEF